MTNYRSFIAERIKNVPVSGIRKFFGIAAKMPDVNAPAIAKLADENNLLVISDEICDQLVYDSQHICFSALPNIEIAPERIGKFINSL